MARQRFLKPEMWADKTFGTLKSDEKLLFIGLFSLADDEGRINADPMYLRSHVFPYETWSAKKVQALRDSLLAKMPNVHLYVTGSQNAEHIALLKWGDHQKPKYPTPSKIPPPFPQGSPSPDPSFPPQTGKGLGSGLDRDGQGLGREHAIVRLLSSLHDSDSGTELVVRTIVVDGNLSQGDIEFARECALGPGVESRTRVAVDALKKRRAAS